MLRPCVVGMANEFFVNNGEFAHCSRVCSTMVEGGIVAAASCQALVIPPRNASEAFLHGGSDDVTPSPMTFVSSLFAEHDPYPDMKPFAHSGAMASPTFPMLAGDPNLFHNVDHKDSDTNIPNHSNQAENPGVGTLRDGKETIRSSATAKYKSMMPSRLPVNSACLTIPPGLSPTTLLESPILFSNGQALPSPTTGSFLASLTGIDGNQERESCEKNENIALQNDNFVFRPHPVLAKSGFTTANGLGSFGISNPADFKGESKPMESHLVSQKSSGAFSELSDSSVPYMKNQVISETAQRSYDTEPAKMSSETETILAHHGLSLSGRTSSDGYNWKKYGQKQLKGTERPRSYYKCTHPNCPVKKHVECTDEGEITEITYKGEHNHPRPQTTRRASRNAAQMILDRSERGAHLQSYEGSFERVDSDKQSADFSSSSAAVSHAGLIGTPEQSFCSPSDEEYEAKSDMEENCEDEQDSKRRRIENGGEIPSSYPPPIRTVREPRVVVQTVSEVDILDDGYRWRKYGQKVVKGHTYPRSYYKCTNVGCGVRKHVERSSSDPKSVRTTYEGKHNHDVPLSRSNI